MLAFKAPRLFLSDARLRAVRLAVFFSKADIIMMVTTITIITIILVLIMNSVAMITIITIVWFKNLFLRLRPGPRNIIFVRQDVFFASKGASKDNNK